MHEKGRIRLQKLALLQVAEMHELSDAARNQMSLFEQSLPFDGTLDPENRWIKLTGLVDWQRA